MASPFFVVRKICVGYLPYLDALGGLAVEGAAGDAEGVVPAVHVRHHAVHALLVHGVRIRALRPPYTEGHLVDVTCVIFRAELLGV